MKEKYQRKNVVGYKSFSLSSISGTLIAKRVVYLKKIVALSILLKNIKLISFLKRVLRLVSDPEKLDTKTEKIWSFKTFIILLGVQAYDRIVIFVFTLTVKRI